MKRAAVKISTLGLALLILGLLTLFFVIIGADREVPSDVLPHLGPEASSEEQLPLLAKASAGSRNTRLKAMRSLGNSQRRPW